MKRKSAAYKKELMSIELHHADFITNLEIPFRDRISGEHINRSMFIELFKTVENSKLFLEKAFSLN